MLPASSVSGDKKRICPYDATHVILAKSYDAHLMKCRENHKGHKMVVCPLDHTHVMPKPELSHHLSMCQKRCLMDREMQKRAGDNGLKGNVMGPPIVADHLAGTNWEDDENWDDAPKRSVPTPALFNQRIKSTPQDSYGIIPGGGYALPPAADEPVIRKIPNNPAKAATLSNPSAAPIRSSRNQVFEFSVGSMQRPRFDGGNPLRPTAPLGRGGAAGMRMTGVQAQTPSAIDQGPRFIGRGISKYATKSNPGVPASASPPPPHHPPPPASSAANSNNGYDDIQYTPVSSKQFEDAADKSNHSTTAFQSGDGKNKQQKQQKQQQQKDSHSNSSSSSSSSSHSLAAASAVNNTSNSSSTLTTSPQEFLQQGILLNQRYNHQQMELAKKHQLQTLQLQKLQSEEKKRLIQEHEKQELELLVKSQALSQSWFNGAGVSSSETSASSPPSSISSTSLVDPVQSLISPGILEAMLAADGGSGLSRLLSTLGIQGIGGGLSTGDDGDPTNEALSRLNVQESTANGSTSHDSVVNKAERSPSDLLKDRAKLETALSEIEILEQKSMLGHVISQEEESKITTKDLLLEQLNALPPTTKSETV